MKTLETVANSIVFKRVLASLGIVSVAWVVIFVWQPLNFWVLMTLAQCAMITCAILIDPRIKNIFSPSLLEVAIGLSSAAILYLVFFAGNFVAVRLFDFAAHQIADIYSLRGQAEAVMICTTLLLIIGPGEEIYWRGLVQRVMGERYGQWAGLALATTLYAGVHIITLNFMLVAASAVCGLFWGLLYTWRKNLCTVIVSHAVWDVVVLVLFPIS
jgi:CAAX protease family protein